MKDGQIVKRLIAQAVIGVVFLCGGTVAWADGLSDELADLNRRMDVLENSPDIRQKARDAKTFTQGVKWSGVTDAALFDRLEKDLLKTLQSGVVKKRHGASYLSWVALSLGYSGYEKYRATIEPLTVRRHHQKVNRHVQHALAALPKFKEWNPIMTEGLAGVPAAELPRKRTYNLLNSNEPELMRAGASLVSQKYLQDAEMLAHVEKLLLENYTKVNGDAEMADAMAWMCKVLGLTKNSEYRSTLETVHRNSKELAILRWANIALSKL